MATLRTLADLDPTCGRVTELADATRQARSMPNRRWRMAVGALCVFAFSALPGVQASAQRDPQPQPQETRPVAGAPSPPAPVSSAIAGWQQWWHALQRCSAIRRRRVAFKGCQPRRYYRSPRRSCEQPDRQEFRVDSSRRRGARADHESRAPSAAAGRYCRQRPVIRRTDPLRWALSAAPKLSLVRTCHRGDRGGMPRCSGFVRAAPDSMKAPDWTLLLRQVLSSANDPCGH
jgi:hypothetical protein